MFREAKEAPVKVDPTVRARLELFFSPKSIPGTYPPHLWGADPQQAFIFSFLTAMQNYKGGNMYIYFPTDIAQIEANEDMPGVIQQIRSAFGLIGINISLSSDNTAFILDEEAVNKLNKIRESLRPPEAKGIPFRR